ncbi:MAG: hypothetical protein ACYDHT_11695, partial [Solirubrobacteraceae bacterium]
ALAAGTLAYTAVFLAGGGMNGRDRGRLREALGIACTWYERRRAARAGSSVQSIPAVERHTAGEHVADPIV